MENVDGYEIDLDADTITIKFTDIFGEGEEYRFSLFDAICIRDALSEVIASASDM